MMCRVLAAVEDTLELPPGNKKHISCILSMKCGSTHEVHPVKQNKTKKLHHVLHVPIFKNGYLA